MINESTLLNSGVDLKTPLQKQQFFDQYKLFVESHQKLTERRKDLSNFYITINSIIISTLGALSKGLITPTNNLGLTAILLALGIGSILSWLSVLHLYYTVNFKSYQMLQEFEKHLPTRVFTAFYDDMAQVDHNKERKKRKNNFLLNREVFIPYCFLVAYLLYTAADLYSFFNVVIK